MNVPVQIWGPGFRLEPLCDALRAAHLTPEPLAGLEQRRGDRPLLLAYAEPVDLLGAQGPADPWPADPYRSLLAALPALEAGGQPWRLVNLSCFCPAQLVGWCVEPEGALLSPEVSGAFRIPEPLDALLTRQWLNAAPGVLEAYLTLEGHSRSAVLDRRPADQACLERLEAAAGPEALAGARRRWQALEADLARADEQLRELHRLQCDNQGLRERALNLELEGNRRDARIAELEARCADLELSLQLAQEDLGQLSRRIGLLEELVTAGASAARSVQGALARALTS
ncbi:hypothetical protein [Cyanobium sp. CH-040]|uniref:hypothetical protein n=1 Tax=Cyanobium sp. CH-040 TaxID=2823708 RepID=UPI0020CDA5EA|nr:hypothetical protein [Cyanobium sp. CH-040]MCP9928005.1 hypothetical protein [Cyanobium sp. CH-040]